MYFFGGQNTGETLSSFLKNKEERESDDLAPLRVLG